MNFWITTHWPPSIRDDPDFYSYGIYLQDGYEEAGNYISPGDNVFIYQSKTGKIEIGKNGEKILRRKGKEGIVALCEVTTEMYKKTDSQPTTYVDGSIKKWSWRADLQPLEAKGFVPRQDINEILGYSEKYNLRGFGDKHSGLKNILQSQYEALLKIFIAHATS